MNCMAWLVEKNLLKIIRLNFTFDGRLCRQTPKNNLLSFPMFADESIRFSSVEDFFISFFFFFLLIFAFCDNFSTCLFRYFQFHKNTFHTLCSFVDRSNNNVNDNAETTKKNRQFFLAQKLVAADNKKPLNKLANNVIVEYDMIC